MILSFILYLICTIAFFLSSHNSHFIIVLGENGKNESHCLQNANAGGSQLQWNVIHAEKR